MLAHNHDSPLNRRLEHLPSTVFTKPCSVTTAISPSLILSFREKSDSTGWERQCLVYTPVPPTTPKVKHDNKGREDRQRIKIAWSYSPKRHPVKEEETSRRLTSLLPVELDLIILGFSEYI